MAIYTKRGDRGETSLYDKNSRQNIRVSKNSLRIEAIGAIDEANSFLGIISSRDANLGKEIKEVQRNLFTIGGVLAGANLRFSKTKTKKLEKKIDKLEGELPVLKNFILPGGSEISSHLLYARTIVRRAEREVVALDKKEKVSPQILSYLNRLSDYVFMLGRLVNALSGIKEETWRR